MRLKAEMTEALERRNMENKQNRKALKNELKNPIAALPVRELCEYESSLRSLKKPRWKYGMKNTKR